MSGVAASAASRALDVASVIGFGIARRALRNGERCRWLDAIPVQPGRNPAVSAMCGVDVYGGTAGIAWFLAQLAVRCPDPLLTGTARAALRQTAAGLPAFAAKQPHGFYGGAAGAAAVLVLAGSELGDAGSIRAGRELLAALPESTEDAMATDLIGGLAGTILALVAAARALGGAPELIAKALRIAERLTAMGARDAGGRLSWPTMPDCRANLSGFAHGAGGIAYALLGLAAEAPASAPGLTERAGAAFCYEDGTFDPARGGWPDFRILPGYPADQLFCAIAWCHGAAGIARARMAASQAGIETAPALAAAIAATAAEAERVAALPGVDFSLCHGLLGLADVLLDATRRGVADHGAVVGRIAELGASSFHDRELGWPSGLPTREELNGLLMGNGGIGQFYLRLADPALPSVLAPLG
jgi:lantibiotic modifying enzyme